MSMTPEQKNLMALIARSEDRGDGWRTVSTVLWPVVKKHVHPELMELDEVGQRIRLTSDGQAVMRYLQ